MAVDVGPQAAGELVAQPLQRRAVLKLLGVGALLAPSAAAGAATALVKPSAPPVPMVATGEVLTAAWLNDLADRVNRLSRQLG